MATKVYKKSELEELAKETFKQFPKSQKVYATVDGNVFLDENRAELHVGKTGTVYAFENPISLEEKEASKTEKVTDAQPKAVDQIASINAAVSLEELEAFKEDTRATVIKALEAKTADLTAKQTPAE